MNILILAAGKGTRLSSYTDTKNKTMFKVNGKPLLRYHVDNLKRIGATKIIISTYWKSEEIEKEFASEKDVVIHKMKTLSIGSGGLYKQVMSKYNLDRIVVVYGDTYYDQSIYNYIGALYNEGKNFIFIEDISKIPNENKDKLNGLIMYKSPGIGKIIEISEKGKFTNVQRKNYKVGKNIGIMILNSIRIGGHKEGNMDLMQDYLPMLVNHAHLPQPNDLIAILIHSLEACSFPEKWCDIGVFERYIELNLKLYKSISVRLLISKHKEVFIEFTKRILASKRIFLIGNGGSLSTCQHLALDWSKVGKKETIALDSPCAISAYGNDEGYENVFVNQLKRYRISDNDVILLISGSGNSPNIVKIIQSYPKNILLGMSGQTGKLIESVKLTLSVPSDNIRVIEDAHLSYGHAITEVMDGLN